MGTFSGVTSAGIVISSALVGTLEKEVKFQVKTVPGVGRGDGGGLMMITARIELCMKGTFTIYLFRAHPTAKLGLDPIIFFKK